MDKEAEALKDQFIKWYVSHAGLIITHPFLTHLFKLLEYLDINNKFKSAEVQSRAVLVLYFIATGEENIDNESDLVMLKILCNMTVQQSLSTNIDLNEEERRKAIEMVNVIIERWDKLGKTSVEGIRNTFFRREGVIELEDKAYQLTIESKGTDILLDFIPWNINMIQLPWMDNLIYISWR